VQNSSSEKGDKAMETNVNGTYFQEGDYVRIKRGGEKGRINAVDGGVVYVVMDVTNESHLFSAYVDEDAAIELITPEAEKPLLSAVEQK
jgi:hypothetical protein